MADTVMGKAGHLFDYMYIIMTKLFGGKNDWRESDKI
jgi:hypothetical protein